MCILIFNKLNYNRNEKLQLLFNQPLVDKYNGYQFYREF